MKAHVGDVIFAEGETVEMGGRHYFHPDDVNWDYIRPSDSTRMNPLRGKAGFYHLVIKGKMVRDGAMVYERPYALARRVRNRVAFVKYVDLTG